VKGSLRLALIGLGLASVAAGVLIAVLALTSDHEDDRGAIAALGLVIGWSFAGAGLVAWWRRPDNRTGPLMVAAAFAWFGAGLNVADDDVLYTIGLSLDALFPVLVGHLLLGFPGGRLQTRAERIVIGTGYVVATVLQLPSLLFEEQSATEPQNLLVITEDQRLSDLLDAAQYAVVVVIIATSITIQWRRWRAATPPQRRAIAPVWWTGGLAFVLIGVAGGADVVGAKSDALDWLALLSLSAVPFGFLIGLLRSRLAQGERLAGLVAQVGQAPGPETIRAALADALGDPSVSLAYWLPEPGRFVDAEGRPVELPDGEWTPVELHGRRIAAIRHDRSLSDEPQLVRAAGSTAALALENARLAAELRARIEELRASRARIVSAGDTERRRLERNLHDGAQARMVGLAAKLGLARSKAGENAELAQLLEESRVELMASLDELRAVARGLHPAVLTDRGLDAAVRGLAFRSPVPVEVEGTVPDDLPPPVATALYYVVAEALTNVGKYAQASGATVSVRRDGDDAVAEIADDGVGGADAGSGSGLQGLGDRVAALDGRLEVESPPGAGTRVRARVPCVTRRPATA
jgi:signal transduction histidine kinase